MRIACLILPLLAVTSISAADLRILPGDFTLHGSQGRQQLSVVTLLGDRIGGSVSSADVQLQSSDPSVVRVEGSVAVAVADGSAKITARHADGRQASVVVNVVDVGGEHRWSFRNDVQSVFSKIGCNSGACHGALAGKGGFRLSLRGYDSDADFKTITREARGRRVELSDPGASLLLAKPTGALPHKGGLKLDTSSRDYQVIAGWIASGAAGPAADDARLQRISVSPESALLRLGDSSQILVSAHYDDGRLIDVTSWSQFSSTDEAIATVDASGVVSLRGSGEGAVLVWFGSKVALARMTVPYPHQVPSAVYASAPRSNFIDEINVQQLETLRLRPSPRCDDDTFLRRSTLDTIGRLPTADERAAFWRSRSQLGATGWSNNCSLAKTLLIIGPIAGATCC